MTTALFHGSINDLTIGSIMQGRGENYKREWSGCEFYLALERHRPAGMLAHHDAVFAVACEEDVDCAGGGTDYLLTLKPLGAVSKHDLNWSSEISCLMDDGADIDSPEVKNAATNYWAGIKSPNESVWEYLMPAAQVVAVEPY